MSNSLLAEVENWKLEARLEDNDRYFYHHASFSQLETGGRSYVIGRKGSGKSAIAQYMSRIHSPTVFSKTLTFGHFPFNDLYKFTHDSFRAPNQYITFWKYLIYSEVAKLLLRNEAIAPGVRDQLSAVYGRTDVKGSLASQISHLTSSELDVSVLGIGGGVSRSHSRQDNSVPWISRTEILERFLLDNMDGSRYFVMFDELDEDYSQASFLDSSRQYAQLLTSLFKAVLSIRATFYDSRLNLCPVVFLRDDIYYALQDPDKTKWSDLKLDLDWSDLTIQNLLAFRLSRAQDISNCTPSFKDAWHTMFVKSEMPYGNRKSRKIELYKYVLDQTHLRPRDFIKYLQICAQEANYQSVPIVTGDIVKRSARPFSNYLRSELQDEIHAVLPDIKLILDVFSSERKQDLSIDEFSRAYEAAMRSANRTVVPVEQVLQILFHFSVIGNQPKQQTATFFKYRNPEATLNFKERIVVHKGLFKSLQVV